MEVVLVGVGAIKPVFLRAVFALGGVGMEEPVLCGGGRRLVFTVEGAVGAVILALGCGRGAGEAFDGMLSSCFRRASSSGSVSEVAVAPVFADFDAE
jgi:hypothetical protein